VAFGLHGHFVARPGKGSKLAALLLEAAEVLGDNDACLLYVISRAPENDDCVWVTEAWTDKEAHDASLEDERVRTLIQRARPLIANMAGGAELLPVGGKGLSIDT
jgi:quinol monooxygenase YgiN